MRLTVLGLSVFLLLVACETTKPPSYRDTSHLELPPALQGNKKLIVGSETDDSSIPKKKAKNGLGDAVYLTTSKPLQLKIKQPFDDAWNTLAAALKQSNIKITDKDHDRGLYYVTYDADTYVPPGRTFTDRVKTLFTDQYSNAGYVLRVTGDDNETQISTALAEKPDAANNSVKPNDRDKSDGADKLLSLIYETMRDKLSEE